MATNRNQPTLIGGRPYLGPAPRARMTIATLMKLRHHGFGEKRHEFYKPWIRVRRSVASPVGCHHIFHVPGHRALHLLSTLEQRFANLAGHLGALEIREQMPWHPAPERHPAFDPTYRCPIPGSDGLLPGLDEVSKEAGIDPGRYPGTDLTFVLTTDLVLTVRDGHTFKLVYWPVKPSTELIGKNAARRRERLELERRRAASAGAHFQVVTNETLSEEFFRNLDAFKPSTEDLLKLDGTDELLRFAERFNQCKAATLSDAWASAASFSGMTTLQQQRRAFGVAFYRGLLDINPSGPVRLHLPISWGGLALRSKLRRTLLGVSE